MNQENVLKSIDFFAKDDFESCKEILDREIDIAVNDYLKTSLELEKNPLDIEEVSLEE
jgi:hypothetical protein